MGRVYAGILGPLAMATVLLRSLRHGGGAETSLVTALASLAVFAAIGYMAGALAGWIVEQSVRSQLALENPPSPEMTSARGTRAA